MDMFRDSSAGQIVRFFTKNRLLQYPEEKSGFTVEALNAFLNQQRKTNEVGGRITKDLPKNTTNDHVTGSYPSSTLSLDIDSQARNTSGNGSRASTNRDAVFMVDWYTENDQENPQNWTALKKSFVLSQLCAYTMAIYGASSMYVPGEQEIMEKFHVGPTAASLGLTVYVLGYGIGPLLFAPLSEIPAVGRNVIYITSLFIFLILSVPTALVDNFAGLLVLRFLTGFFGSPCLANGGASVGDMYSLIQLPISLSAWTTFWFWGPAIGPIIAGFAVQEKGWRWGLWEIVWLTAPIVIVFFFTYPETSAENILHRRAQRLRKLTGREDIKSRSEIDKGHLHPSDVIKDALIKPAEIMIKDPAILFTNVYTSLTYGIYYTFFEVFPLVYGPIYGFNLGETGLCFLTIGIACVIALTILTIYQLFYFMPDARKNGFRAPERRLVPALFAVFLLPAGYFIFGWTARREVHWIVSLIGVVVLVASNFVLFQSIFVYLPLSYPRYAASLFAANDLCRSLLASACILFARPLFINLGIGGGVSLVAGLACIGILGMFYLWKYGAWLRSKSTFAQD